MKVLRQKDIHSICIGVLMGGYSSEREISIKSGKAVSEALKASSMCVKTIIIDSSDEQEIIRQIRDAHIDVAFIALHGHLGEDGRIQEILEKFNIPYTGSGIQASRTAIDKVSTYKRLLERNVRVPKHIVFKKGLEVKQILERDFSFPVVVKPSTGGSSIGVSLQKNIAGLSKAIKEAFSYSDELIIEEYIRGKELTVGVLGNKLLPVVEIQTQQEFFDFKAKYRAGMTQYIIPAQIDDCLKRQAQKIGFAVHQAIGCRHFSRTDIILTSSRLFYVLETNTIPGFTSTSLLPKAAQAAGIDFKKLCFLLVQMAYYEKDQKEE